MSHFRAPALALLALAACAPLEHRPAEALPAHAEPPVEQLTRSYRGADLAPVTLDEMCSALADADVVFLGETHLDETTHRVELAVFEALLERTGGSAVLSLEMFERDVQPALDDYLAGKIDETEFRSKSRPWGNYRTAYRPLIEAAKRAGAPVVAANVPASLRRKLGSGGRKAFEELSDADRALVARELLPSTPEYWERVDNAVRGHAALMGAAGGEEQDADARLFSGQSLWDNTMAESIALARERHPDRVILHVNGGFHSAHRDGTVRQLLLRAPDLDVRTVAVDPASDPAAVDPSGAEGEADFLVFAAERARDVDDDYYAVKIDRELRYRFELPHGTSYAAPVPLLIWLGADDASAADGLALCRARLGKEVALAVVEPPYPSIAEDLGPGSRWIRPGAFNDDAGNLAAGVQRIWGYLLRYMPVDPERVVVAGEGSGASVALAAARFAGKLRARVVAIEPDALKDLSALPLPQADAGDPGRVRIAVLPRAAEADAWKAELAQYAARGLESAAEPPLDDAWLRAHRIDAALRTALGLAAPPAPGAARAHVVIGEDGPRARLWAELAARRHAAESGAAVAVLRAEDAAAAAGSSAVPLATRAADAAEGKGIPLAPGPFGGTTVLVIPDGADAAEEAAWRKLVDPDVLTAKSRFHRLRVATAATLREVVDKLAAENRKNLLVVPAEFCASGARMRELRDAVGERPELTLRWLPGLGGG